MEDPIAPHTPGHDTQRLRRVNRLSGERHETRRLRTVGKQETAPRAEGTTPSTPGGPSFPVLPVSEHDALEERLRHAVSGFVDSPRGAVEEADALLDELAARITALLADRRDTLRSAWHADGTDATQTEELRLAMRGYRNVLERLLTV